MSEVAGLWVGKDPGNTDTEFLVTVYDDGSATIAYRDHDERTWGRPFDLDKGAFARQCIGCGQGITGMAVMVFETYPRTSVHDTGMRRTDDLMCIECGSNGRNVVSAP